jgi:ABC-type sugar transport system ATPase subunit
MIKIGDIVRLIDEPAQGIVTAFKGQRAIVDIEGGFEEEFLISKLIKIELLNYEMEMNEEKHQDSYVEIRPEKTTEIDLHIESLFVHWKKIPSEEYLHRQINAMKEELYLARKNKLDKLIVIHGKGKGILKNAIIDILNSERNLSYQAMTKDKYKDAAIEIYFN